MKKDRNILVLTGLIVLVFQGCINSKTPFDYTRENPLNVISITPTPGYCQDIALMDTLAYLADGEAGVEIVNIKAPSAPEIVGFVDDEIDVEIEKVRVVNSPDPNLRLLLTVPSGKRVDFYSLSNPKSPENLAVNAMSTYTEDLTYLDRSFLRRDSTVFIFTADRNDGLKFNGYQYSFYTLLGDTTWSWFQIDGAGDEYPVRGFPRGVTISDSLVILASDQGGVDVFRINDLYTGDLTHEFNFDTPGSARHACKVGDYIYVADGRSGLVTYSITERKVIFILEGIGYARYIMPFREMLFISAGEGGLLIASITDGAKPEWVGRLDLPYVYMSNQDGNLIYIADRDRGLVIAELK